MDFVGEPRSETVGSLSAVAEEILLSGRFDPGSDVHVTVDSLLATSEHTDAQLAAALEELHEQQLVTKRALQGVAEPAYKATADAWTRREAVLRTRGLRHPALLAKSGDDLRDVVLALAMARTIHNRNTPGGFLSAAPGMTLGEMKIYLVECTGDEVAGACADLVERRLLSERTSGGEGQDRRIFEPTGRGDREYTTRVQSALGLDGNHSILRLSKDRPRVEQQRFNNVQPLGAGDHGEVWKATDTKLGRSVALKFIPLPTRGATALAHARALADLSHSNIIQVYDVLDGVRQPDTGAVCDAVVMEFLEGQELRSRLAAPEALTAEEARAIAEGILDALDYLQEKKVVHGDLHAGNVMLTDAGPKLIDVTHDRLASQSTAVLTDRLAVDRDSAARMIEAVLQRAGIAPERFLSACRARSVAQQRAALESSLQRDGSAQSAGNVAETGTRFSEIERALAQAQGNDIVVADGYWEAADLKVRPSRWMPQGQVQYRRQDMALMLSVPRGSIWSVTVPFALIEAAWVDLGRLHIALREKILVLRPESGLRIESA